MRHLKLLFTFSLVIISVGFAQNNDSEIKELKQKIKSVEAENMVLKKDLNDVKARITRMSLVIDSLNIATIQNNNAITKTNKELGIKIDETDKTHGQKISAIDKTLGKNTLYGIIGVLVALIISILLYVLLGKKMRSNKSAVEDQISRTKQSLEEEGIKLDTKLTEVLETQLKIVQSERSSISNQSSEEVDHSLALKVADEIMRINKNISNMDSSTKGIKQLTASVKRIEDNFAANGYEMPELLNKPFDVRSKMIATILEDENLEKGKEIISKIIKPQVNYKGVMIQAAQVEVSVGQK